MNSNAQNAPPPRRTRNRGTGGPGGINPSSASSMSSVQNSRPQNRAPMRNNYSMGMPTTRHYPSSNRTPLIQTNPNMSQPPTGAGSNSSPSMTNNNNNSTGNQFYNEQDASLFNGVYKNKRLVHTMTAMIGCMIEVQLEDGKRYEGILKTYSPEFEIVLCSATLVVEDSPDKRNNQGNNNIGNLLSALENKLEVADNLVVDPKKLVSFKVTNVDLDYACKKAVMTDSEIAKNDGTKQQRELVPWESDELDPSDTCFESLETPTVSNGWKCEDMFKLNESKFKLETTYQDDMNEYTCKLETRNDEEYQKRAAMAAKIAKEIEGDSQRTARYAKEDELDEESLYSAVIRPEEPPESNMPQSSGPPPNNNHNMNSNYNNHHNYRNEMNHPRGDDRRGDTVRSNNNQDMGGFRTQNNRQPRNRLPNRDRPGAGGPSEPNWRDSNNRMGPNRYANAHPPAMVYNPKTANTGGNFSGGSGSGGSGNTGPQSSSTAGKYVGPNQYSNVASQSSKTSYSAVSARNVPPPPPSTEIDGPEPIKTYRGHPAPSSASSEQDSYNRKQPNQSQQPLPQRDSFVKRTPYNRVVEPQHDSSKASKTEPDLPSGASKGPISGSTSNSNLGASNQPEPIKTTPVPKSESVPSFSAKVAKTDHDASSHPPQQQQQRIMSPKNVPVSADSKKSEPSDSSKAKPLLKPQASQKDSTQPESASESNKKIEHVPPPAANSSATTSLSSISSATGGRTGSPMVATNTGNSSGSVPNTPSASSAPPPSSSSSGTAANSGKTDSAAANNATSPGTTVSGDEIVTSSKLNPNAKSFTPRTAGVQPQTPIVPSYPPHYPPGGHMPATTPPSIPTTPSLGTTTGAPGVSQFIPYAAHPGAAAASHLPPHASHHQAQPLRYNIPFQTFGNPMIAPHMFTHGYHQFVPNVSHFAQPMAPPPSVSVPSQTGGPQAAINQAGPPQGSSQIGSHHIIPNTSVASGQVVPQPNAGGPPQNQPNQPPQQRNYRSGSKGPTNAHPNQASQQMIRHHDFSQQSTVANVTGQPIMTGTPHPGQHLSLVYPAPVHPQQNQMHGQPPSGIGLTAAGLAASQSGHNPYGMTYFPRPLLPTHPNALNMTTGAGIPGMYDGPIPMYCTGDMQPMMAQSITSMPQLVPISQGNMPQPQTSVPVPANQAAPAPGTVVAPATSNSPGGAGAGGPTQGTGGPAASSQPSFG